MQSKVPEIRMPHGILSPIGAALRARRRERRMTQQQLARRVGRSAPRVSELERDLLSDRMGRDRLGLLAEMCDALGLAIVLAPIERVPDIATRLGQTATAAPAHPAGRVFDDVFVDLSDEGEDDG